MGNQSKRAHKELLEKRLARKIKEKEAKKKYRAKYFRKRVKGEKRVRKQEIKVEEK